MKRPCPICCQNNFTIIFHDHNRREGLDIEADFVKCKNCGMKYLTNIPSFTDIENKYPDIYIPTFFDIPDTNITKNNLKVLDIGCNFGLQLKPYYLKGYEVYGIDLNQGAINDAQKNIPKGNFKTSKIENSNFPNECFDIIRTSHVLEHIYNLNSFISEVYRILKPGGKFIIHVPNGNSIEMRLFGKYSSQSWVPFHLNLFSIKDLTKKLREFNFNKITYKTNPMPWWWILSFKQLIAKNINKIDEKQTLLHQLIMLILYPLTWIISVFKAGEELIVIAKK